MSVGDDTEEWASRIINELFNERSSPNTSNEDVITDNKVSRNKDDVSYTENNLSPDVYNFSKDCVAGTPVSFAIVNEIFVQTPEPSLNTGTVNSESVSDINIDSLPPVTHEENICLNQKSIPSDGDLMSNAGLLGCITTSGITVNSLEVHMPKESKTFNESGADNKRVENIDILSFNSKLENSSEKLLLKQSTLSSMDSSDISEINSLRNGREYVNNKERVPRENIVLETTGRPSVDDRKRILEKCDFSESQGLKKPRNEIDEIEVTNSATRSFSAVVTNSSEELIIVNDDIVFSEPFKNATPDTKTVLQPKEFDTKKDKLSTYMTVNLEESTNKDSVEDLKRIDEEHECLGFPDTRKRDSGDIGANDQCKTCMSSHLEDFFYCTKNKVEFCTDKSKYFEGTHVEVKCESLEGHTYEKAQNFYTNENLIEDTYGDLIKQETNEICFPEDNMLTQYFDVQCNSTFHESSKRKHRDLYKNNGNLDQNIETGKQCVQKEKQISESRKHNSETIIENYKVCPVSNEFNVELNEISTVGISTEENITPRCISRHMKKIHCTEGEEEINDVCNYDDDIDIEIIAERICKVVTLYRNICSFIEVFFVRPFANIFVEWFEFFGFVFFLSICMLYKCLQSITTQITTFSKKLEMHANDMFERDNTIILTTHQYPTSSLSDPEYKFAARNESHKVELASKSLDRNEIITQFEGTDSFISVEPKDVLIVDNSFELVKENLEDLYYKGESYLELFSREQYKAVVKTYENCLTNIKLLEYNENNSDVVALDETNFDMEIIASSKNPYCKKYSSIASCNANEFSCNLKTIPREYSSAAQIKSLSRKGSNNSLFRIFSMTSGRNMVSILNSTEIDHFSIGVMDKSISSSGYEILSTFEGDTSLNEPKHHNSPVTPPECNSSLSVNLPSFCSRSDTINSISSLDKPDNKCPDQCRRSSEFSKIVLDLDMEVGYRARSLINLSISASDGSESMSLKAERESLKTHKENEGLHEEVLGESHKTEGPESLKTESEQGEKNSYVIPASLVDVIHQETSNITSQDSCDTTKLSLENSNVNASSSNNFDSLAEIESVSKSVRRNHKRKSSSSLRRRMSLILFNWKNIKVMPCMMSNTKSKKKYKKYSGAEEM